MNEILEIIQEFSKKQGEQEIKAESKKDSNHKLSLAKIRPILSSTKESAEFIVAASEIFAILAGFCAS